MAGDSLGGAGSGRGDLPEINTSVPHPARVYNYFLGGTDNFEADRTAAEAAIKTFPRTAESARATALWGGWPASPGITAGHEVAQYSPPAFFPVFLRVPGIGQICHGGEASRIRRVQPWPVPSSGMPWPVR